MSQLLHGTFKTEVDKYIIKNNLGSRLISQVHDSILVDVHPRELDEIKDVATDIMTQKLPLNWDWIIVPIEVEMEVCDVNKSWAEKKKV